MAKLSKSLNFKNAIINISDMSIVEIGKDFTKEYSLLDILKDWDGIEGVSLSLKIDDELPTTSEDGDSE